MGSRFVPIGWYITSTVDNSFIIRDAQPMGRCLAFAFESLSLFHYSIGCTVNVEHSLIRQYMTTSVPSKVVAYLQNNPIVDFVRPPTPSTVTALPLYDSPLVPPVSYPELDDKASSEFKYFQLSVNVARLFIEVVQPRDQPREKVLVTICEGQISVRTSRGVLVIDSELGSYHLHPLQKIGSFFVDDLEESSNEAVVLVPILENWQAWCK